MFVMAIAAIGLVYTSQLYHYTAVRSGYLAITSIFLIAYILLVATIVILSVELWRHTKRAPSPVYELYDLNVGITPSPILYIATHSTDRSIVASQP